MIVCFSSFSSSEIMIELFLISPKGIIYNTTTFFSYNWHVYNGTPHIKALRQNKICT